MDPYEINNLFGVNLLTKQPLKFFPIRLFSSIPE
jgi:hypothetical protein